MVFHAWARTTASFAFLTGDVAGGLVTLYPRLDTDTKLTACTASNFHLHNISTFG